MFKKSNLKEYHLIYFLSNKNLKFLKTFSFNLISNNKTNEKGIDFSKCSEG